MLSEKSSGFFEILEGENVKLKANKKQDFIQMKSKVKLHKCQLNSYFPQAMFEKSKFIQNRNTKCALFSMSHTSNGNRIDSEGKWYDWMENVQGGHDLYTSS